MTGPSQLRGKPYKGFLMCLALLRLEKYNPNYLVDNPMGACLTGQVPGRESEGQEEGQGMEGRGEEGHNERPTSGLP